MKMINRLGIPAAAACLLLIQPALAEVTLDAGLTIVGQQASRQNNTIDKDIIGSVDLVLDADIGHGQLHLYLEGSSTPATSASSVIAGSNLDAGTAVDRNGKGRLQLSEIAYSFDIDALNISFGVQDLTGFADATAISNDEGSQFLAGALVNNPAIPFPDYTPSVVLNYTNDDAPSITVLMANAYGLGDNPNADYSDLFRFGRDNSTGLRKGVFALGELRVPNQINMTIGGWVRTSELPQHLGGANKRRAYGLYADLDGSLSESTHWSGRAGWSSAKTTDEVTTHASLAVEHAYREDHVIAFGVAWNGLSSDFKATLPNAANPVVAELYYRWQINDYVAISPDIQYWSHANNLSVASGGVVGGSAWVYGLRLQIGGSHRLSE